MNGMILSLRRETTMSRKFKFICVALVLLLCDGLTLTNATFARPPVAQQEEKKAAEDQQAPQTKPEEGKKSEGPKPGEEKTFAEVIKDMEGKQGLFTFYYKADENKLLLEILPTHLDKLFLSPLTTHHTTGHP